MKTIFLFYDKTYGVCDKLSFSKDLKHCNIITCDKNVCILTTLDKTGVSSKTIKIDNLSKFIRRLPSLMPELSSIIFTYVYNRTPRRWFPMRLNSCNEIARDASGIDLPVTFNVAHLHRCILKNSERSNYDIDYTWRRKNGR